jgi:hypothetical protein
MMTPLTILIMQSIVALFMIYLSKAIEVKIISREEAISIIEGKL